MDYMPLAVLFLLEYFNAVISHIYQCSVGKKLIGQHGHILANLYTRHTEIVALGEQFAVDGFQKLGNGFVVINAFVRHAVEIGETTFGAL